MSKSILVVHSNAVEGRDDEYNAWYDHQHLQDILSLPGFISGSRYVVDDGAGLSETVPEFRHMAVYEIEGAPEAAMAALRAATKRSTTAIAPGARLVFYRGWEATATAS